ncbi:MAG: TRZ/ATZ family hydrolase, partial [Pseudomonadota bacterium]
MKFVDTLIYAGWVVPVEPAGVIYEQHAVAIHEGKIVAILPAEEAVSQYSGVLTYRLSSHALMPGLINAHTHTPMTLLRGYADDMPLMSWLNDRIWPAEKAWANQTFVEDGSRLAIAEMLLSGTTCFNDMYFYPETTAQIAAEMGVRACIGLPVFDFPTIWAQSTDEYLSKGAEVYETYRSQSLVNTLIAPHAPYTLSDDSLSRVLGVAEDTGQRVHMHVHETADEVNDAEKNNKERPIARLERIGLFSVDFLAVHMTQLTEAEIEHLVKRGIHVLHCPESNLKLASGFCPVQKLLDSDVNVALGTDGVACNNDLDMFGEMHTAALLAKGVSQDATAVNAAQALQMATLNGARALGIAQE